MSSAAGSLFARVYAGHTGVDPYTTARLRHLPGPVRRRHLHRQGPLRRRRVHGGARGPGAGERAALPRPLRGAARARGAGLGRRGRGRLPVERARPRRRQHRWVRGDWQILSGCFPWVPTRDGSSAIGCRSSAAGRSSTTCAGAWWRRRCLLVARLGMDLAPGAPARWTLAGLAACVCRSVRELAALPSRARPRSSRSRVFLRASRRGLETAAGRCCSASPSSPITPTDGHAIVVTLVRLGDHAAPVARVGDGGAVSAGSRRRGSAGVGASLDGCGEPGGRPGARRCHPRGPAGGAAGRSAGPRPVWLVAPALALRLSRPLRRAVHRARAGRRALLAAWRARPGGYFETFVGPEDHWLPPDNVQESPRGRRPPHLAHQHRPAPALRRSRPTIWASSIPRAGRTAWKRCSTTRRVASSGTRVISSTGTTPEPSRRLRRATCRRWTAATSPVACWS